MPARASPGGRSLEHLGINGPVLPSCSAVAPDEPGFCCGFHNSAELALAQAPPLLQSKLHTSLEANAAKARQLHRSRYSKML